MTGFRASDIAAALAEEAQAAAAEPEGLAVLVVTDDDAVAREVAPMLASRLHPTIPTNGILYSAPMPGGTEVVLRVGRSR